MNPKVALVTDFDGTISDDDFFWFIADKYFDEAALAPWNAYIQGQMTHFDALNAIFKKIRLPEAELLAFIDTIRLDSHFETVANFCKQENIPLYIVSAGCDYYIKHLLGTLIAKNNIHLVTNHGVYNPQTGLQMIAPVDGPFYDREVGISKAGVVKKLLADGYQVVFAGDGPPDFAPAQIANVVFAKKILLEKCLEANIKTEPFADFMDVYRYLKEE